VRRCRGRLAPWSSRARWASSKGQEVQKRYAKCAKINEPAKSGENALCSVSWMRVKAGEKVMLGRYPLVAATVASPPGQLTALGMVTYSAQLRKQPLGQERFALALKHAS
jgi:hypothetical protein